ncbi:hypothetical protein P5673_033757 [Acropora cervicornis]|uniref:Uncharacterized protein n=1 Tax=Acropora cervicornis TaxID=6130 RepID=A0AAD9UR06_ACRCE|nr:hypothetical protein P5673_033757 [Acropora cervicornis]
MGIIQVPRLPHAQTTLHMALVIDDDPDLVELVERNVTFNTEENAQHTMLGLLENKRRKSATRPPSWKFQVS